MALLTQFGTATTANTSLTPAAVLVGTFTNTVRIRKLYVNIYADQIKGGGDYVANIRIQRAGAGSEYVSIKTTLTLAAGVTAGYFGSIPVTLNATDVMKVYLLGTAADSDNTADIIVDVNEEYISTDANGYMALGAILGTALTETVAGRLAASFKKFGDVGTPVFTAANVNQAGDAYTELTDLEAALATLADIQGADGDTLKTLSDQLDAIPTTAAPTAASVADAVWNEAAADHVAAGSVGAALTNLVNRLGAFTGSGVNTVLGFLKAMAHKAATLPTDMGGTFDPALHSEEALYAAISALPMLAPGAKEWPYLVNNTGTGLPDSGVDVWFTTVNLSTATPVWRGTTDSFGYAKNVYNHNPWLDLGTYYVWKHKDGFNDPQFPDVEVVV